MGCAESRQSESKQWDRHADEDSKIRERWSSPNAGLPAEQRLPVRATEGSASPSVAAEAPLQTCPICFEDKDDVEVLSHWQPRGDISEHKMCRACLAQLGRNECPFCKEVLVKDDILSFIGEFIASVSSEARTKGHADACAAVLERWQFFEMEHEGQPAVIQRVAKLIVEDPSFMRHLEQAGRTRQTWVHEMAGIFFRFHGMYVDGELHISEAHGKQLTKTVEQILSPLEQRRPDATWLPRTGTPLGALVSQALVAWLCAWRSGGATKTLEATVQRVGHAVVHCHQAHGHNPCVADGARKRIHPEYLALSHTPVWGSQEKDIVWQTFFKQNGRGRTYLRQSR